MCAAVVAVDRNNAFGDNSLFDKRIGTVAAADEAEEEKEEEEEEEEEDEEDKEDIVILLT
jgi:ribosomal protein L12E/L44/L45/RPP1/RPP2